EIDPKDPLSGEYNFNFDYEQHLDSIHDDITEVDTDATNTEFDDDIKTEEDDLSTSSNSTTAPKKTWSQRAREQYKYFNITNKHIYYYYPPPLPYTGSKQAKGGEPDFGLRTLH